MEKSALTGHYWNLEKISLLKEDSLNGLTGDENDRSVCGETAAA